MATARLQPTPNWQASILNIWPNSLPASRKTRPANVAAYYAGQKPNDKGAARNPASVKLGEKIYRGGVADKGIAACAGCHGPAGAGIPAQYPRLAGQWADYTKSQLVAFRAGERQNDPQGMMRGVAAKLSDKEIDAVSDYIAGLKQSN